MSWEAKGPDMTMVLMGLSLMGTCGVGIYALIPAKGIGFDGSRSSQWVDVVVAIIVGAFIAGLVLTVVGLSSFAT